MPLFNFLDEVKFDSLELAIAAGTVLIFLIFLKIFVKKTAKIWRSQSHVKGSEPAKDIVRVSFFSFTIFMIFLQVTSLLIALAGPVIPKIEKEKIIFPRERIDLLDVSASMCFSYGESSRSQSAIARDNYLKFLRMRRGKSDRVAIFLFSNKTYRIQNFTHDGNLQRFSAFMAPEIISRSPFENGLFKSPYAICNKGRVRWISGEGGTELDSALQIVVDYSKLYGSQEISARALLLVTDAAVDRLPVAEFEELKRLKIRPYMIFIKPNKKAYELMAGGNNLAENIFLQRQLANSGDMIKRFSEYGWKYYEVSDEDALRKAYEEIDKFEGARFKEKVSFHNESLARYLLFAAMVFGFVALILGLLYEFIWGDL